MKDFFEKMMKDYQTEDFTWKEMVVYGVLAPLGLILVMALAGWLETSCA